MNKEILQKAIDNLSLQMVYLYSTEAKFHNNFDPLMPEQELVGQYGINMKSCQLKEVHNQETDDKQRFLVYKTVAGLRYLKGDISDEILENEAQINSLIAAEITAVFVAEYLIQCEEELPQEAILEFGRVNVPHQIWTYWREYCHATCARMSLPVSIMPMFSI